MYCCFNNNITLLNIKKCFYNCFNDNNNLLLLLYVLFIYYLLFFISFICLLFFPLHIPGTIQQSE